MRIAHAVVPLLIKPDRLLEEPMRPLPLLDVLLELVVQHLRFRPQDFLLLHPLYYLPLAIHPHEQRVHPLSLQEAELLDH
jgi:hypothetical protein